MAEIDAGQRWVATPSRPAPSEGEGCVAGFMERRHKRGVRQQRADTSRRLSGRDPHPESPFGDSDLRRWSRRRRAGGRSGGCSASAGAEYGVVLVGPAGDAGLHGRGLRAASRGRGCGRPHRPRPPARRRGSAVGRDGVVDVGRRGDHRADQPRALVHPDVGLVAVGRAALALAAGEARVRIGRRTVAGPGAPTPPRSASHPASSRA